MSTLSHLQLLIHRMVLGPAVLAGWLVCHASVSDSPSGWIAPGSPAATPFYVHASTEPGPRVLITGGIHGDEPAGAYAAEQIRHWPIRRGTLVIVPRANAVALEAGTRMLKSEMSTNRYDLNRAFPPATTSTNPAARLAARLWEVVQTNAPAWLLDLHEGVDFRVVTKKSVGSSVIPSASPEARRVAELMVNTLNASITNADRRFVLLNQPVKRSLARAAADELGARTMIVETTTKSQSLAFRARQHRIAVHTFLRELGMLDAGVTPESMIGASALRKRRVAVYDGGGNGGKGVAKVIQQAGADTDVVALRVCPEDIRAGALRQFDAVVFAGGSGSGQAAALGETGREAVRRFVEQGGGYIGICAGAYLACHGFTWGLGIIDAKTLSPRWRRGTDMVKLELTEQGCAVFGQREGEFDCLYYQGPIVGPAEVESVPDYITLARFRTEVAKNDTPKGIMIDSPAVFGGQFGQGRVLCFSPHPEQTPGLEAFVLQAIAWVSTQRAAMAVP